jgi:hypothetical protein
MEHRFKILELAKGDGTLRNALTHWTSGALTFEEAVCMAYVTTSNQLVHTHNVTWNVCQHGVSTSDDCHMCVQLKEMTCVRHWPDGRPRPTRSQLITCECGHTHDKRYYCALCDSGEEIKPKNTCAGCGLDDCECGMIPNPLRWDK